jgi:hypothetical protein
MFPDLGVVALVDDEDAGRVIEEDNVVEGGVLGASERFQDPRVC